VRAAITQSYLLAIYDRVYADRSTVDAYKQRSAGLTAIQLTQWLPSQQKVESSRRGFFSQAHSCRRTIQLKR
jgi:hypothetical protein